MNCISPLSVPRPNGKGPKDRITVNCGKCFACLQKRRNEWSFRLEEEAKIASSSYFVTLTYDDNNVKNELSKDDIQRFIKRLRKELYISQKNDLLPDDTILPENEKVSQIEEKGQKMRYFISGEYGPQTHRAHYHGIFYNVPGERKSVAGYMIKDDVHDLIQRNWQMGHVSVGNVTPASINYVTKYMLKEFDEAPFCMMSTKPGLGSSYLERAGSWNKAGLRPYAVKEGGVKVSLPRYFKEKIFNINEKQLIGKKALIDIDKNYNRRYNELLKKENNVFAFEIAEKEMFNYNQRKSLTKINKL